MNLLRITDNKTGESRFCEITNLFDIDGDETHDLDLATAAVVKWSDDKWVAFRPYEGTIAEFVQVPQ